VAECQPSVRNPGCEIASPFALVAADDWILHPEASGIRTGCASDTDGDSAVPIPAMTAQTRKRRMMRSPACEDPVNNLTIILRTIAPLS